MTRSAVLPAPSALDRAIFGSTDVALLDVAAQAALRVDALRTAFAYHLENCAPYARYAEQFDAVSIDGPKDLSRVPQFPTTVFKRMDLLSVPREEIVACFSSSGTRGAVSRVWRNEITLQRLAGSLASGARLLHPLFGLPGVDDDVGIVHLGPPRAQANGIWFAYVMGLIEVVAPTRHQVSGLTLDLPGAAADLCALLADRALVCLVGPPAFVLRLAVYVRENGIGVAAGDRLLVVTGGGWKLAHGEAIDRQTFHTVAAEAFGLASTAQIRDAFNQVELNTVLFECASGRKHVPAWVEVIVRSARDLTPVALGAAGVLSYLDASAQSYPAFILAEDVGRLWPDSCPCGRPGRTVEVIRRIEQATQPGCAVRLEERLARAGLGGHGKAGYGQ